MAKNTNGTKATKNKLN